MAITGNRNESPVVLIFVSTAITFLGLLAGPVQAQQVGVGCGASRGDCIGLYEAVIVPERFVIQNDCQHDVQLILSFDNATATTAGDQPVATTREPLFESWTVAAEALIQLDRPDGPVRPADGNIWYYAEIVDDPDYAWSGGDAWTGHSQVFDFRGREIDMRLDHFTVSSRWPTPSYLLQLNCANYNPN